MSPRITHPRSRPQKPPTRHVPDHTLEENILLGGAAEMARKTAALTLNRATLTDSELHAWKEDLERRLESIQQHPEQNLGFIEEEVARAAREPLRLLAERAAQAKANNTPCQCPHHRIELGRVRVLGRSVDSRFGPLKIYRPYGWCEECQGWHFPADLALGLNKNSPASPYLQEVCALLNSKMPSEQAVAVANRFGLELSRCFIHREAHRQGLKAEKVRQADLGRLDSWEGIQGLASENGGPRSAPFTLILEIDAWNIRERDDWGRTAKARQEALSRGQPTPSKWHWVYVGTVFRLDHRGQTAGERALISQRAYACTRLGIGELMRQVHREAIACGLGKARDVLVIADGAVWIWNAVQARFPEARCRLDLYHADEHLWAVANELYGKGTPEARQWVEPVLKLLRQDDAQAVIRSLEEIETTVGSKLQKKIRTQVNYFEDHKNHLNYREILRARKALEKGTATHTQKIKANEPLGSGAIESTCRQYQCRFKRTGQFWSNAGDEALLCLETFWRNHRWHDLFPHAKPPSLANN